VSFIKHYSSLLVSSVHRIDDDYLCQPKSSQAEVDQSISFSRLFFGADRTTKDADQWGCFRTPWRSLKTIDADQTASTTIKPTLGSMMLAHLLYLQIIAETQLI
jgi:hypothetical protein